VVALNQVASLQNKRGLTNEQYADMRKMLASLTPAERKTLSDPDFITEDEADLIVHDRRMKEPTVSLDEAFREAGIAR
jgi:hypothetical protein